MSVINIKDLGERNPIPAQLRKKLGWHVFVPVVAIDVTSSINHALILSQIMHEARYNDGDAIINQAALATQLGFSRMTVRGAIRDLVDAGYIETRKDGRLVSISVQWSKFDAPPEKIYSRGISYYPRLTAATGNIFASILLAQAIYYAYSVHDPKGWHTSTMAWWHQRLHCCLSTVSTSLAKLRRLGLIESDTSRGGTRWRCRIGAIIKAAIAHADTPSSGSVNTAKAGHAGPTNKQHKGDCVSPTKADQSISRKPKCTSREGPSLYIEKDKREEIEKIGEPCAEASRSTRRTMREVAKHVAPDSNPQTGDLIPAPDSPASTGDARDRATVSSVWKAYAEAYEARYGAVPPRNAKSNGQIAQLLKRIPNEDAEELARYYVGLNDRYYVARRHPIGLLLRDCEVLHARREAREDASAELLGTIEDIARPGIRSWLREGRELDFSWVGASTRRLQ